MCSYFFSLCGIHVSGCLHLWNVDSDVCLGSGDFLQLVLQPIWLHCYHWLRLRSVLGQLPWTRGKFWPLCPQGFEIAQSIQSYKVSIKGTPSLSSAEKKLETAHYLCVRLESCLMKLVELELSWKNSLGYNTLAVFYKNLFSISKIVFYSFFIYC